MHGTQLHALQMLCSARIGRAAVARSVTAAAAATAGATAATVAATAESEATESVVGPTTAVMEPSETDDEHVIRGVYWSL